MTITMPRKPLFFLLIFGLYLNTQTLFSQNTLDTIMTLDNPTLEKAVYKAPNGKTYKVKFADDPFAKDESGVELASANCIDSTFAGTARKLAKTSLVTAPLEDFATISALLKTLAKDAVIRPKLSSTKPRIAEEKRHIRLLHDTYLYAFKKEPDNDYHLIIGDHKSASKATFFNIELSGLARNATLSTVRAVFEKRFVNACTSRYIIFSQNPVKIQVEGSLFFDFDHKPGQVGPAGFRPTTCWELHPMSKLVFL